jgi:hypothetical protein
MCCFSQPVQRIANTRIFARRLNQNRQYLAYQMAFQTIRPTAMILPLPVALPTKTDTVRFISLKEYPDFFDALTTLFTPLVRTATASDSARDSGVPPSLPVETVGDFVASFVPTMKDFSRLDPRFVIKPTVWRRLPRYRDYGFAVFQLKVPARTLAQVHPIALEFHSRLRDRLFFPTVHIHDGQVHTRETFDHALYWQGRGEETWTRAMRSLPPTPPPWRENYGRNDPERLDIGPVPLPTPIPTPTPRPVLGPDGKPLPPRTMPTPPPGYVRRGTSIIRWGVDTTRDKGLYAAGKAIYRWSIQGVRANEDILI